MSAILFSFLSEFLPYILPPMHSPLSFLGSRYSVTPLSCPADCTVYPVSEDVNTPGVRFSKTGEVVVGLLPPVPGEVLAGLTFTVTTSFTNTVLKVLKDNPKTLECWRGSYLRRTYKNLPSFATDKSYEWRHILVSLRDGKVLLNDSLDVCPGEKVEGSNPTLVVSTLKRTNVAFNCQEGKSSVVFSKARRIWRFL